MLARNENMFFFFPSRCNTKSRMLSSHLNFCFFFPSSLELHRRKRKQKRVRERVSKRKLCKYFVSSVRQIIWFSLSFWLEKYVLPYKKLCWNRTPRKMQMLTLITNFTDEYANKVSKIYTKWVLLFVFTASNFRILLFHLDIIETKPVREKEKEWEEWKGVSERRQCMNCKKYTSFKECEREKKT